MLTITEATTADIPVIRALADKTWRHTYAKLLSPDQLEYMLKTIYSPDALQQNMTDGSQTFLLASDNGVPQGFAAFGPRPEDPTVCKLHKLYVLPENHGKGYGRLLIDEVKKRIAAMQIYTLDLNVKKDNPARTFYEKLGFAILREEDIPFGPYVLHDYVMRIKLSR